MEKMKQRRRQILSDKKKPLVRNAVQNEAQSQQLLMMMRRKMRKLESPYHLPLLQQGTMRRKKMRWSLD